MKITSTTEIEIDETDILDLVRNHVASLGYEITELKQDGCNFHIMAEPTTGKGYRRKEAANPTPSSPLSSTRG